ncbi:MAG: TM2 domain-containing protein [Desulfovibrionaceae bacterium]|nr:TM2 domain-containing protein [Desulfovibrionaceae bacterium]
MGQYQNSGQAYGNAAWQGNPGPQQTQQPNAGQWAQPQNIIYQGVPPVFCQNCGNQIDPRATLCLSCGCQIRPVIPKGKSRVAAGILGILLGGLGIHKFYMGRIGFGILYLLFFWTWIPAIIGFIEGIIYLCESDEKFAQRLM